MIEIPSWVIRKNSDEPYDTRGASIIGPRTDPRTVEVVPAARLAEVEAEMHDAERAADSYYDAQKKAETALNDMVARAQRMEQRALDAEVRLAEAEAMFFDVLNGKSVAFPRIEAVFGKDAHEVSKGVTDA